MAFPSAFVPDFGLMVSAARADGWTRASQLGYAPNMNAGTAGSAWGQTGSVAYPWITNPAGQMLEVVAGANDVNLTGTGAWTASFGCLDTSFNPLTIVLNLNGTTPVAFPVPVYRINSARIVTANRTPGTGLGTNGNDVIIRDAGGGTTRAIILAGKGFLRQAAFTTPAGFTTEIPYLLLNVDNASGAAARKASFETYFAGLVSTNSAIIRPLPISNTNVAPYNHLSNPPLTVPQMNDFDLPIFNVSDNGSIITAGWNGVMKRNSL